MTELRNFDINLHVAFKALMRERNISKTTEKMFISQSAISHVLHCLRQQLDDPVLVKTSSGMQTHRVRSVID